MQTTTSKSDAARPQIINEVARAVIALPDDTSFYRDQLFISVAFDAGDENMTPEILGGSRSTLPFLAAYEIFSRLCGDRAMRTVDGRLQLGGEAVAPERYLTQWRRAIGQALSPSTFAQRHSLAAYAVLGSRLEELRGERSCWRDSPFKTFAEFEERHCVRIDYPLDDQVQRFRVELDLRVPHAARDAFYLASLLSSARRPVDSTVCTELKAVDPMTEPSGQAGSGQIDLFNQTLEAA